MTNFNNTSENNNDNNSKPTTTTTRASRSLKLTLIGHGRDHYKLKDLSTTLGIEKNVKFLGWVKNVKRFYFVPIKFCLTIN